MTDIAEERERLIIGLTEALEEFRAAHREWLDTIHDEDRNDAPCYRLVAANKRAEEVLALVKSLSN